MTANSVGFKHESVNHLPDTVIVLVVALYATSFIVFGFLVDTPADIAHGLIAIATSRDTLLTDYFGVGGIGGAFVNAGILALCACLVFHVARAKMTGAAVACLFLVLGFGLFGKNLLNTSSIVLGVFLYSKFKREPFATNINAAFFGAALAPIFSEILFSSSLSFAMSLPLAVSTGLLMGFILAPIAAQAFKAHMGFSLYNMGFAAGLLGILVVALFKSYGFVADPVFIWTTGNNVVLGGFLTVLFASMIGIGFYWDRALLSKETALMRTSGQAPTDFIELVGIGPTLANMGVSGSIGMAYVLIVGGELNGPVIGAILAIVGFAAFGKHPKNIVPIMLGVFLGSLAKPWGVDDPSMLLAALFGTTLAPIAGRFGWHWGIVAGFLHSSAAQTVGYVHAGLNLYNNGFAAGIVATILVPIIIAIQSRAKLDDEPAKSEIRVARMDE